MNWIKRIFNWKKAPKATNEMKPVEIKVDEVNARIATLNYYIRVKYSWKRSPKHYYLISNGINSFILRRRDKLNCSGEFVGNLYTLYQQYYGKENKD